MNHLPTRPRPLDWQDRIVITAAAIAIVVLLAILTWGR